MSEKIQNEINEISKIVGVKYPNSKTILFGSYARGTAVDESNIDICVLLDELKMRRIEICHAIRKEFIGKVKKPIDILVFKKDEFEINSQKPAYIEYTIAKEGIEIE